MTATTEATQRTTEPAPPAPSAPPPSLRRQAGTLLWRGPAGARPAVVRWGATATTVAGAGLIVATAAIHLYLWSTGYRFIATIGVLFLAQGIAGVPLALAVAATRRVAVIAAGAGYLAASAVGLILADTVGLFGFHDSFAAPYAGAAFATEVAGFVLLAAAGAMIVAAPRR